MSYPPGPFAVDAPPVERLAVLFDELAELTGQRNAIDGRIVEVVAEMDHDGLIGSTGCRSISALVAWRTGCSPANAAMIATIAHRLDEFPRCTASLREGRLSLDQVGVIAERAGEGSDAHYAELAKVATVSQLRTAVKQEPRPDPDPTAGAGALDQQDHHARDTPPTGSSLPHVEAAKFDAALASHRDAQIADMETRPCKTATVKTMTTTPARNLRDQRPPMPTTVDAFMALVDAGWDAEVTRRPHGQRTTVVVHLDVMDKIGSLHLVRCSLTPTANT